MEIPVTAALKVFRGWRYVLLKTSNWDIAVFAVPIALTIVANEPAIGATLENLLSVFRISWLTV